MCSEGGLDGLYTLRASHGGGGDGTRSAAGCRIPSPDAAAGTAVQARVYQHESSPAIVFWRDGQWRLNGDGATDGCLHSNESLLGQWAHLCVTAAEDPKQLFRALKRTLPRGQDPSCRLLLFERFCEESIAAVATRSRAGEDAEETAAQPRPAASLLRSCTAPQCARVTPPPQRACPAVRRRRGLPPAGARWCGGGRRRRRHRPLSLVGRRHAAVRQQQGQGRRPLCGAVVAADCSGGCIAAGRPPRRCTAARAAARQRCVDGRHKGLRERAGGARPRRPPAEDACNGGRSGADGVRRQRERRQRTQRRHAKLRQRRCCFEA